jgi:hypothetical protein
VRTWIGRLKKMEESKGKGMDREVDDENGGVQG